MSTKRRPTLYLLIVQKIHLATGYRSLGPAEYQRDCFDTCTKGMWNTQRRASVGAIGNGYLHESIIAIAQAMHK